MATYFLKRGSQYRVTTSDAMDLHDKLPAGNYVVKFDPLSGFYVDEMEDFAQPKKIYGNHRKDADRILNTFSDRKGTTGVLLSGEKGSGKTMVAKLVSHLAIKKDIPTLVVNSPYMGDAFNSFLDTITQPCVVLFDEFEKVFDKEQQKAILTLLDGIYGGEKLYVLTCNDKGQVDIHLRNRPGRIFYMLEYNGVDEAFIREYCRDNLKAEKHTDQVCVLASMFECFTFDMLQALIEEMNRYNESPSEAVRILNAKPDTQFDAQYEFSLKLDGKEIPKEQLDDSGTWYGNPLKKDFWLDYYPISIDGEKGFARAAFSPGDVVKLDAQRGITVFENLQGYTATLTKFRAREFNFTSFLTV